MKKRILIAAGVAVGVLCAIEIGGACYFQNHFLPKTSFNGVSISGKSIDSAKDTLDESLKNYVLTIQGDDTEDQLAASDIDLCYDYENENSDSLEDVMANQNSIQWFVDLFQPEKKHTLVIDFDSEKLTDAIEAMNCMNPQQKIPSENARLEYEDGTFETVSEVYGNEIAEDELESKIIEQLSAGNTEYQIDCYVQPTLTADSEEFNSLKSEMETALQSSITLKRDDISVSLSSDDIASVLSIGDDLTVTVDTEKLTEYVNENIKDQFNTVGKTRTVTTLGCGEFQISGGTYGYVVDVEAETEQLAQDILSGETIEREPKYSQEETYQSNGGLGNTYIDVSISQQTVWLVSNGNLIIETPCVTGNVTNGTETPTGMYWIEFKRRNYDMPKYGVSVSYWMPIDTSTGVGLHDAAWRSTFGGSYYITTGSHGCINLPVSAAKTIYNNCFGTMPVVVH